jgi:hypothetical protein
MVPNNHLRVAAPCAGQPLPRLMACTAPLQSYATAASKAGAADGLFLDRMQQGRGARDGWQQQNQQAQWGSQQVRIQCPSLLAWGCSQVLLFRMMDWSCSAPYSAPHAPCLWHRCDVLCLTCCRLMHSNRMTGRRASKAAGLATAGQRVAHARCNSRASRPMTTLHRPQWAQMAQRAAQLMAAGQKQVRGRPGAGKAQVLVLVLVQQAAGMALP